MDRGRGEVRQRRRSAHPTCNLRHAGALSIERGTRAPLDRSRVGARCHPNPFAGGEELPELAIVEGVIAIGAANDVDREGLCCHPVDLHAMGRRGSLEARRRGRGARTLPCGGPARRGIRSPRWRLIAASAPSIDVADVAKWRHRGVRSARRAGTRRPGAPASGRARGRRRARDDVVLGARSCSTPRRRTRTSGKLVCTMDDPPSCRRSPHCPIEPVRVDA